MNAELQHSLENALRTEANVTSSPQANECVYQATNYWIKKHVGQEWHIVVISIMLTTVLRSAVSKELITQKPLGILQRYTLNGFDRPNALWVYETDRYTETWVHELVLDRASGPNNRILNVERNDPGEIVDLGQFKLG